MNNINNVVRQIYPNPIKNQARNSADVKNNVYPVGGKQYSGKNSAKTSRVNLQEGIYGRAGIAKKFL